MHTSKYLLITAVLFFFQGPSYGQTYERYVKLADTSFSSAALGYDKQLTLTVPIEWQANLDRTFPLFIIFDRQNNRSHQFILNTIDYLTSTEQIPAGVLVSIESGMEERYPETLYPISKPGEGRANDHDRFLFDELIPWLRSEYKANDYLVLIGHSRFGYYTSSLVLSRPNEVDAAVSLSPFFGQPNVELVDSMRLLMPTAEIENRCYYRFGIGNDYPEDYQAMITAVEDLDRSDDRFNAAGFWFPEAAHNTTPGLTISWALYEVFEYWAQEQNRFFDKSTRDLSVIREIAENIQSHYGEELAFSIGTLNGKGWGFYNAGEYELALAAWEILVRQYPNFSDAWIFVAMARSQLGMEVESTYQAFRESLETSTMYSSEEREQALRDWEEMVGE